MNRRSFMKAVGVAAVSLALPAAEAKRSVYDMPGLVEPCDVSFTPEWHQYEAYISEDIIIHDPDQMAMNWQGIVNRFPLILKVKEVGLVAFTPETLLFTGVNGIRKSVDDPFTCKLTLTRRLTGGFNDDLLLYERGDLHEILSKCEWFKIEEAS